MGYVPGWYELDTDHAARVVDCGRCGFRATVYPRLLLDALAYRGRQPDPQVPGLTVLGDWPTEARAVEAARDMIAGMGKPRVCTPADIESLRKPHAA